MDKPFSIQYDEQSKWHLLMCNYVIIESYELPATAHHYCGLLNNAYRLGREYERKKVEQQRNEKEN